MARAFALTVTTGIKSPALFPALFVPVEVGFQGGMNHLHFDHHPAEDLPLRSERAGPCKCICQSGFLPVVFDEYIAGLGCVPGDVGGDSGPRLAGGKQEKAQAAAAGAATKSGEGKEFSAQEHGRQAKDAFMSVLRTICTQASLRATISLSKPYR